jgi:tetratricopeptide (TPR) repeat protein
MASWPNINPSLAKPYYNIAIIYHEQNRYDKEIEYLQKLLKIQQSLYPFNEEPNIAQIYSALSIALLLQGAPKEALEMFQMSQLTMQMLQSNHLQS